MPDLLAYDSQNWHVVESKGCGGKKLPSKSRAKKQATAIRHINGRAPKTCCASVADLRQAFTLQVIDPAESNGEVDIQLEPTDFMARYYSWALDVGDFEPGIVGGAEIRAMSVNLRGFKIGLVPEVYSWMQRMFAGPPPVIEPRSGPGWSVGPDGVVFRFYQGMVEDRE